jgi:dipeptidyl aminopeptidase/acylaminoacyl peptidase
MILPSFRKSLGASLSVPLAAMLLLVPAGAFAGQGEKPSGHEASGQVPRSLNRSPLGQVAVSPDGKRLAWVQDGHMGAEIHVAPIGDLGKSQRIATAATADQHCRDGQITWSPDSTELAFLSECASQDEQSSSQTELYLARLDDAGPARILISLKGYVDDPAFSPDGSMIAFLYVEGATRPASALAAIKPFAGVIGEDGIEIQRVARVTVPPNWNGDPAPPPAPADDHPVASRAIDHLLPLFDFLTPASLHVYEFDWAPDSKSLGYIAADPPGENNWWVAKLYTQALGGAPKTVLAPAEVQGALHGLQIAVPRWSPDGKSIAFIGGLMSDQGVTGGDVFVVSASGGEPQNLTPQRPSSAAWITWKGNDSLFADELAGGRCQLVHLDLHGSLAEGGISATVGRPVFSIPGSAGDGRMELSLSATADRSLFVFNASSFDRPTETYSARPGEQTSSDSGDGFAGLTQLTSGNDGVQPDWGKTVSLDWTSDAFHVQGWLMLPKDYDPAKKYPMIVEVHGGPASAVLGRWGGGAGGFSATAFSALGYFVLMPNPRGSYGQGEAFTQANRKDFGYGDLRDILAGVDTVLAKYPVDPNRVGLAGWSYGGFMTMFAITQTNRFRAAVSGAGISDWLSYYGENSIDQWMIPYFGASVYDDPQVYAKSSAITYIKQAHTPTLAVVGDRDGECPAPQSFEFWHALRDIHVPSELVVYPNEGHGFVDPVHIRDVIERAGAWFARYMPPSQ